MTADIARQVASVGRGAATTRPGRIAAAGAEPRRMRNRALHDALRDFALEAASLLSGDLDSGADLEFEVDEEPGRRAPVLYSYRPLTGRFIDERWPALRALATREPAERALGAGAEGYLRTRGAYADDAEPALRAMLERLWEESTSFAFPEERFERVYAEVESTLYRSAMCVEIVAPLPGLALAEHRIDLGGGLSLRRGEGADAPPEALWPHALERRGDDPSVLCVLERDLSAGADLPLDEARSRFRRIATVLRLWGAGALSVGPVGWARVNGGTWRSFPLPPSGTGRGGALTLDAGEGEELGALLDALAHSRPGGAVAWAVARFEMGCERAGDGEALSDYLLALEALLDGGSDLGRATLSLRMAALCADEHDRRAVQRRVELAFALERFLVGGGNDEAYLEEVGSDSPRTVVLEIEEHLRAILRDVICGYLDTDLRSAADDVLLESSEPIEIRARDLRVREEPPEPRPLADEHAGDARFLRYGHGHHHLDEASDEDGVTPSEEWAADDASVWSAPI